VNPEGAGPAHPAAVRAPFLQACGNWPEFGHAGFPRRNVAPFCSTGVEHTQSAATAADCNHLSQSPHLPIHPLSSTAPGATGNPCPVATDGTELTTGPRRREEGKERQRPGPPSLGEVAPIPTHRFLTAKHCRRGRALSRYLPRRPAMRLPRPGRPGHGPGSSRPRPPARREAPRPAWPVSLRRSSSTSGPPAEPRPTHRAQLRPLAPVDLGQVG